VEIGDQIEQHPSEVAATGERPRPAAIHMFGWFLFFAIWTVLAIYPFIAPLNGGEEYVIPPGLLNDPMMVAVAIVGSWFSFLIAAVLVWRSRLSGADVGFRRLPFRTIFRWSVGILTALIGVWIIVSAIFGDDLKVVEPLTQRPSGLYHWMLWMGLAVSAGFCEEFVVRGYGTGFLMRWGVNRWVAAVITSVLFGILHIYEGPHAMLVIAVWGLLFAIPFVKTGSIWPGVVAHTAIDAIAPFFV
jgi:membrane protease YdiL (CAAX protease family)